MNIVNDLPIILIIGGIGIYFMLSGIMALVKKRMTVVNPYSKRYPLSSHDAIINIVENKIEDSYKVPEGFVNRSPTMDLKGNKVLARALFHIIIGLTALFVLATYLDPAILDRIMPHLI